MAINNSTGKKFLKNSFFLMLASVAEKGFFFIINIAIARYLTKEQFGEYATALSFATFFSLFANMGIGSSSVRLISRNLDLKNKYFSSSQIVKLTISIMAYIVMCITLMLTDYNSNIIYLTVILGIVRIGNEYLLYLFSLLESASRFITISIYLTLFAFSFMTSTVVIIMFKGDYFDIVHVRLFVLSFFVILTFISTLKNYNFTRINLDNLESFTRETIPFSISVLLNTTTLNLAPLVIPFFHDTVFTGIYTNAYIFFTSLLFIPTAISKVIMPHLYKFEFYTHKDVYQKFLNNYGKIFSVISYYCVLMLFCFSKDVIILFFGRKYTESIPVLSIMAFAIPFAFNIAQFIIPTINKQRINSIIDIAVFMINIPLSILLIKFFNVTGAAITIVLIYITIYILSNTYLLHRGFSYRNIFIFRLKLLFLSVGLAILNYYAFDGIFFIIPAAIISFLYLSLIYFLILSIDEKNLVSTLKKKKTQF